MKCQFCGGELPEDANFCFHCNRQIACLSCGKPLVEGAKICVYCGSETRNRFANMEGNHIKFTESDSEKSFEASFSDETAGNVVSVFTRLFPGVKFRSVSGSDSETDSSKEKVLLTNVQGDAVVTKSQSLNTGRKAKTEHPLRGTKSKVSRSSQPKFLEDLDLSPAGKESLVDFMAKHIYRQSASQLNLLFVYYLKQVRKVEGVNQDHVFTCYRTLGLKIPNNLYHTISDNISKNRWFRNASNLELTVAGLNKVEQEMKIQ